MASLRGGGSRDRWAEIAPQGYEDDQQHQQPPPKTQIAVVYGRRRAEEANPRGFRSKSDCENRVSFVASKRTSWNRSLSIRGRESIVVDAGAEYRPQPKQRVAKKIPRAGQRTKKAGQERPDFRREKEYFEEVDAFELIEESPSPKHFGTWAMGRQQDCQVHDLPDILERWKLSKLAYSCRSSQQLFKILETPSVPSVQSSTGCFGGAGEKTPERIHGSRVRLNLTSYEESINSRASNHKSARDSEETSILNSLNALRIKDENVACDTFEDVEASGKGDISKEVEGAIRKDSFASHSTSLTGECLGAFIQLLMVCKQSAPVRLSEVFSTYCEPSSIVKIGEGTYGEAFGVGDTVCKIVPIDGDHLVNGEVQKKSEEVLEEVLLSLTLNSLRNQQGEPNKQNVCTSFIETKDFRVCQGTYDACLISAWEQWDAKYGSENDHPRGFSEQQCYIVFILADGGKDLESFVLLDFDEARSLLVQVTAALAVAESACEFEHRDLHWGNILLSRNEETIVDFVLEGRKTEAKTFGLKVSIIDFTLSRINTGEAILFLDLSTDPGIFEGPKGDRQSETYRKMKEVTQECWEGSFPETNVLWLIYLVDTLLMKKSFKRTTKDERDLRSLKKRLNSYSSAKDTLSDCFFNDLLLDPLI